MSPVPSVRRVVITPAATVRPECGLLYKLMLLNVYIDTGTGGVRPRAALSDLVARKFAQVARVRMRKSSGCVCI